MIVLVPRARWAVYNCEIWLTRYRVAWYDDTANHNDAIGRRIGEAANPGPGNEYPDPPDVVRSGRITFCSHNMNGAQGKLGHAIRLANKYALVVAQEMDIPCGQMGLYAGMLRKAATQIRYGDPMHIGDQAGQHARVAHIASDGMVLLDTQLECDDLIALKRTGR